MDSVRISNLTRNTVNNPSPCNRQTVDTTKRLCHACACADVALKQLSFGIGTPKNLECIAISRTRPGRVITPSEITPHRAECTCWCLKQTGAPGSLPVACHRRPAAIAVDDEAQLKPIVVETLQICALPGRFAFSSVLLSK